jgi:hypothetical protein
VALLITGAVVVTSVSKEVLAPLRMTGSAVRTWSGYVLVVVGVWFVVLAFLPGPVIGS